VTPRALFDALGSVFAALLPRRGDEPAPDNGDLMTLEEVVASRIGVERRGHPPRHRQGRHSGGADRRGDLRVKRDALERTLAIVASNYGPPS
jgi:hypothetical protein